MSKKEKSSAEDPGTEIANLASQISPDGLILSTSNALASSVPEHLREFAGQGTEEVRKYLRPGRLKVLQSNRSTLYAEYPEGGVLVTPVNMLLAENEERFHFVPLLFFSEWCTVNPFQMKDKLPMIRAQSFDPASDIARRSRDKELRTEKCPENEKFMLRHKQYFNFVCWLILQPELSRIPVLLSFSGGEYARGQRLCDMISMKASQVPIWGQIYEGRVPKQKRISDGGEWYGIDVGAPSVDGIAPFVMNKDEALVLKEAHESLKRIHAEKLLVTDHGEDEAEIQAETETGESKY